MLKVGRRILFRCLLLRLQPLSLGCTSPSFPSAAWTVPFHLKMLRSTPLPRQSASLLTTVTATAPSSTALPHLQTRFHPPSRSHLIGAPSHTLSRVVLRPVSSNPCCLQAKSLRISLSCRLPSVPQDDQPPCRHHQPTDKNLMKNRLSSLTMKCSHFSIDRFLEFSAPPKKKRK